MYNLGVVKPGTTLYLPFHTFDSNDPSASTTITGLATTDIEVYKDGSATQRASDAGYALLDTDGIDFDTTTGVHGISIDLADNTTAGFYAAGSQYWVVIASITVDGATVNFILATFTIGYPDALVNTTLATLASQTSFTLTAGSADDDAYNGWRAIVHDVASAIQVAVGYVSDYTGSTKTITLAADPGVFTMAATDNVSLLPPNNVTAWNSVALATTNPLPNASADAAGGLPISDLGGLDLDSRIQTDIAAILADTAEIGVAGAGLTDLGGMSTAMKAEVNAEVDGALDTAIPVSPTANSINERVAAIDDKLPSGTISDFDSSTDGVTISGTITTLDGLNNLSAAEVATEISDAWSVDTVAELSAGTPPSTPTRDEMAMAHYMALRNKLTVTSSSKAIHNDAGTQIFSKALTDDATTYTEAEAV